MLKTLCKELIGMCLTLVLAGCADERAYRGYEIIDPQDHNYVLVNRVSEYRSNTLIGPQIRQWNVWKEYIFLYKSARPGDYSDFPYTDLSGYAIVNTKNGAIQFFDTKVAFETEVKKLNAPDDKISLHKIPGPWRPNSQDLHASEKVTSPTSAVLPLENPASVNP